MRTDIDAAGPGDLPAVKELLDRSGLPSSDLTAEKLRHFLVARAGGGIVGVIGVEPLGEEGLLRSAAVAAAQRGQGLGGELVAALERRARELAIRRLYLLTTTAETFFRGRGYRRAAREEAPAAVQATTEFRELCASTSVCMVKDLGRAKAEAAAGAHDRSRPATGRAAAMGGVTIERPQPDEYAAYYLRYIEQVPDGDLLDLLRRQIEDTTALLAGVSERDAEFRYAEGKWSIRDVVGHLADVERIFVYRALCFARGERGMLPGFEENDYVDRAKFGERPLPGLVAEFQAVRAATVAFFAGLDAEELSISSGILSIPYMSKIFCRISCWYSFTRRSASISWA